MSVTWILDFDYDFTAPQEVSRHVEKFVVVPQDFLVRWPEVDHPCVAYGTMRKLMMMTRQPEICEAVFDDYLSLRCSYYYRYIYEFLGRKAFIIPFQALTCVSWSEVFSERVFIRPDQNTKPFDAQTVNVGEMDAFVERYRHRSLYDLVVVSEVVELGDEYRCFCRNGRVFCHSSYPEPPYHPAPPRVLEFAEKVATLLLDKGFSSMLTIDVACGDRLRVVEIGGVNSWGIYGANIEDFIRNMEEEAIIRYQEM
ncbi:ATP-grasp domain-containing protein [Candidatus Uabimicrobium amorphum]|uniref:ATP-grasp domain-containing protein n=1 Tax=Uabimicrobium amorphum TaxID=2596890 RepID=A0A5S9IN66_UABAM|nr:ATP-grasp domain-containing protein [Candidatus Uabimicrobium amorphum]BBM84412.1 hypothetical protein UABAM_02771 [Candidatus Uabimicrobium amorphum]